MTKFEEEPKVILHVASLETFIPPFVKLINKEFSEKNHQFWLTGEKKSTQNPIENAVNVFIAKNSPLGQFSAYLRLLIMFHRSEKIILHGLFNHRVVLLLTLSPWLLKKCYWIIWGGDLYQYQKPKLSWRAKLVEKLRKFVIKRIGHLVTYIPGDAKLAREWYGATGAYRECLMYLSNVVDPKILLGSGQAKQENSELSILVGNSADPSNNHFEVLEKLKLYKNENIKIYVPLSYGDRNHAQEVIERGKKDFGDKFVALSDFMPFEQYVEFLKCIDIVIFNHKRQQAMGNTITLLGMGKTVFMRKDVSQRFFLESVGLNLKDVSQFSLEPLTRKALEKNIQIIRSQFSRETLKQQYSELFEV